MILGIDICEEFAQVSVYNRKENTADTKELFTCEQSSDIPMKICKKKGAAEWAIGDDMVKLGLTAECVTVENIAARIGKDEIIYVDGNNVTVDSIMDRYIECLLNLLVGGKPVERICVCVWDYSIAVLDCLRKAFLKAGYDDNVVEFINRDEGLVSYVLNQKRELWYAGVVIFDYKKSGLIVNNVAVKKQGNEEVAIVTKVDYSAKAVPPETTDEVLTEIAKEVFDGRVISSVYLTGVGFDTEVQPENFVKFVCNKRRVFVGQNMYSKGACFKAYEATVENAVKRMIVCDDKIMYELDIEILERGKSSLLRVVKPGTSWYAARKKYDFFLEGKPEIVARKTYYGSDEVEVISISLEELPVRPDKTTKLGIGFDFDSAGNCTVSVKDRGFGNFFKSSGKIVSAVI